VKDVYGGYIENVTRYLRLKNNGQEETLPFSNISFTQQSSDYDDGSFEYHLHYHQSQPEPETKRVFDEAPRFASSRTEARRGEARFLSIRRSEARRDEKRRLDE
jgi:hypothetical protein